ncbi:hypothetical protein TNCV_4996651 [Trichonephila clavipes]|nr:hypothetical protein TNCV_4996651 [Trichonephila clavipes]
MSSLTLKSAVQLLLRNFHGSKIRLTSRTQAAPVGLGPFNLLPIRLGAHCKFSNTLSSPNHEKTKAQCYGISFRLSGQPGKRRSESLTNQLRNSFPAIREISGIFPCLSAPILTIRRSDGLRQVIFLQMPSVHWTKTGLIIQVFSESLGSVSHRQKSPLTYQNSEAI